ncbi:MAG: hypothetical protein ABII18_05590 [bacterium]
MKSKPQTSSEFTPSTAEACKSVMLEIISCLGPYRKHFVLVGGLVPKILIDRDIPQGQGHVGTYDVDFAVNFLKISKNQYATIAEMLFNHDYSYRKDKTGQNLKFSFEKTVSFDGLEQTIYIDLVGPEYGGKNVKGFREKVQDGVHVHKARGVDLVFDNCVDIEVTALLPDGIKHTETVSVVNGAAFAIVKAITFESRKEPKDAYDIYYCLKNYQGGLVAINKELQNIRTHGLVKEGMSILQKLFVDPLAIGPQRAARFISDDPNQRSVIASEFSELVASLLKHI